MKLISMSRPMTASTAAKHRHRVIELEATREEAAPMERGHAEDRRFGEVEGVAVHHAEVEIEGGEGDEDAEIPEDGAHRPEAVAGKRSQNP